MHFSCGRIVLSLLAFEPVLGVVLFFNGLETRSDHSFSGLNISKCSFNFLNSYHRVGNTSFNMKFVKMTPPPKTEFRNESFQYLREYLICLKLSIYMNNCSDNVNQKKNETDQNSFWYPYSRQRIGNIFVFIHESH